MTNTNNLTRAEAEAAARAGAKVRHEDWNADWWLSFSLDAVLVHESGAVAHYQDFTKYGGKTGWSIVTPAPDAGQPDAAKGKTDGDGVEFKLKAMALNYTEYHIWDHLDADACQTGYNVIMRLREAVRARGAETPAFATTRKPPPDDVPGEPKRNVFVSFGDPLDTAPATNPHPEGSRKWAKFEMKRGRKVRRESWPSYVWIKWAGKRQVRWHDRQTCLWSVYTSPEENWQLVGEA